ncbi:MAG: methyltransferase domain-containing protein [Anaerolineae bacterium]|nr:methyltransferase domain-containing protein [Anaerolineae bacterium]
MGNAAVQGELWGQVPRDWVTIQEPHNKPLFEAMLDGASVDAGTRFLDAGCGGGGASVLAAERGAKVSGIDAAEGLLEIARKRLPTGDFRAGDLEDLPFETESFDAVFAANSVQFPADRLAAVRELGRVCTPEGRIVAGLFGPPEKVALTSIFMATVKALPEPPPGAGPFALSAPGKLEALFEEAGLKVLERGEVDCPYHYPDFETCWRGYLSAGPSQGAVRAIGQAKLKAAVREAVRDFQQDDGSILIQPNVFVFVVAAHPVTR